LMPSIYKTVFESTDLKFEDSFQLKKLPCVYKIHFNNGKELTFSGNHEWMKSQLESIEQGSYLNFKRYIDKGYKFFQISMDKLLGKNFFHLFQFIKPGNISLLIDLKTYLKHNSYIKRFFKDSDLRRAFTFQNIYVGQSPLNSPALFAMLPAVELTEGALFPVGGMYRIVEILLEAAMAEGVQFHFNTKVEQIQTSKDQAQGIKLQDGNTKTADIIVVNADLPYAYTGLLPDNKKAYRIRKMKYACSAIVFHWGIDKLCHPLEHHNIFLSGDYIENLYMIFNRKSMAENPSFYIHRPTGTDPSASPAGHDSLSVIVPVGHRDNTYNLNWDEMKKMARTSILNRLGEIGLADLEKHIISNEAPVARQLLDKIPGDHVVINDEEYVIVKIMAFSDL